MGLTKECRDSLWRGQVFGVAQNEESGDSLLESVLKGGGCGPSFKAEAIIDKEVVSV